LVWRRVSHHRWQGAPPGQWTWAEATHMSDGGRSYWYLRLIEGREHLGNFPTAETAMRYADSFRDVYAAARRL
jgi:hypothetical protein